MLDAVNFAGDGIEIETDFRGRLVGEAKLEALRRITPEGAGNVFEEIADAVAVEVAVPGDEVDVPAGLAGAAARLIEDPLLPRVGKAVVIGVDAEARSRRTRSPPLPTRSVPLASMGKKFCPFMTILSE